MKTQLEALFAVESKEAIDSVLEEMGFVPAPGAGSIVLTSNAAEALAKTLGGFTVEQLFIDPSMKTVTRILVKNQAEIQEARETAKKETLAYVKSIFDICALGGMEKMALGLIREGMSIEGARVKVQTELANDSSRRTQIDGANPLVEAAKKDAAEYVTRTVGKGELPVVRTGSDGGRNLH